MASKKRVKSKERKKRVKTPSGSSTQNRKRAARRSVSKKKVYDKQKRSNAAKRGWISRRAREKREKKAVATPTDILQQRVIEHYERAVSEGKIIPVGKHDSSWVEVTLDEKTIHSQNIYVGELLQESNVEEILSQVEDLASKLTTSQGKVMCSIQMYEYGEKIIGSPTGSIYEDDEGIFTESYQGIPALSYDSFITRIKMKLEQWVDQQERSASLIESITIRVID